MSRMSRASLVIELDALLDDTALIDRVAQRLCLAAGDSWDCDQGAKDCYRSDVGHTLTVLKEVVLEALDE